MSADRLRQAATLLRERSEVATPGPWDVSRNRARVCAVHPQVADAFRVVASADRAWIDFGSNAAYIALMSPPVALALADWLLVEAHDEPSQASLNVANMILGDAS